MKRLQIARIIDETDGHKLTNSQTRLRNLNEQLDDLVMLPRCRGQRNVFACTSEPKNVSVEPSGKLEINCTTSR